MPIQLFFMPLDENTAQFKNLLYATVLFLQSHKHTDTLLNCSVLIHMTSLSLFSHKKKTKETKYKAVIHKNRPASIFMQQ